MSQIGVAFAAVEGDLNLHASSGTRREALGRRSEQDGLEHGQALGLNERTRHLIASTKIVEPETFDLLRPSEGERYLRELPAAFRARTSSPCLPRLRPSPRRVASTGSRNKPLTSQLWR